MGEDGKLGKVNDIMIYAYMISGNFSHLQDTMAMVNTSIYDLQSVLQNFTISGNETDPGSEGLDKNTVIILSWTLSLLFLLIVVVILVFVYINFFGGKRRTANVSPALRMETASNPNAMDRDTDELVE